MGEDAECMDMAQLVYTIIKKYYNDQDFRILVDSSPEFYRACIYECGLVDAEKLDGTPDYQKLVDMLEGGWFWVNVGISCSRGLVK